MSRLISFVFITTIASGSLLAQPTWSEDVAPIVFSNCVACHVDGGIGPFPLTTYAQNTSMSAAIAHAVEEREMPPFPADVNYQRYAHERVLTDAEINTIVAWAEGGSPEGNPDNVPDLPERISGPSIKNADLIVTMPLYTSTATNSDVYRCFTMPANNLTNQVLEHVEVIPGNPQIVHHVLVYVDTSDASERLDARDEEPGYPGFGGVGSNSAELIAAFVPGIEPVRYPSGFGLALPAGSRIIFQVHYPEGSDGQTDQTQFRAKFSTAPNPRIVAIAPILSPNNMTDGPLVIPANTVTTFHQEYTLPIDVSVISIVPHMHLLGKSTKVWAVAPNQETTPLISIPQWDFHWQMVYTFRSLQRLERGTKIRSEVVYDNTENNPENPSSPPKTVRWGEATTDEMILTYFAYVWYQDGDENIRLDEPTTNVHEEPTPHNQVRISPNPASTYTVVRFTLDATASTRIRIVGLNGQTIATHQLGMVSGNQSFPLNVTALPSGRYEVVIESGGSFLTTALVVN